MVIEIEFVNITSVDKLGKKSQVKNRFLMTTTTASHECVPCPHDESRYALAVINSYIIYYFA